MISRRPLSCITSIVSDSFKTKYNVSSKTPDSR